MLTFITLPTNFVGDIASTTNDIISGFGSYIILIIGVLLAGVVIEMILGAIRHR